MCSEGQWSFCWCVRFPGTAGLHHVWWLSQWGSFILASLGPDHRALISDQPLGLTSAFTVATEPELEAGSRDTFVVMVIYELSHAPDPFLL
jgi:hypothetical protein